MREGTYIYSERPSGFVINKYLAGERTKVTIAESIVDEEHAKKITECLNDRERVWKWTHKEKPKETRKYLVYTGNSRRTMYYDSELEMFVDQYNDSEHIHPDNIIRWTELPEAVWKRKRAERIPY